MQTTERRAPRAPTAAIPPPRANRWLAAVAAFLAVALIALGAWVVLDRAGRRADLSRDEAIATVDAAIAAWNAGDEQAIRAAYAEDAVFEDLIAGTTVSGVDAIAAKIADYRARLGMVLERASGVAVTGDVAAYGFTYGDATDRSAGLALVEIEDGVIVHQTVWAMSDVAVDA